MPDERDQQVSAGLYVVAGVLLLLSALFALGVVIHNAPLSPATLRMKQLSQEVTSPFFVQRWTLFAPDPIDVTYETYYQFRWRDDEGQIRTSRIYNLTSALRAIYRRNILQPRVNYVAATLESLLLRPTEAEIQERKIQETRPEFELPPEADELLRERRDRIRAPFARLLSCGAEKVPRLPGDEVLAVRGWIMETPVPLYGDRHLEDPDVKPVARYDSGWLPYVEEVTCW